MKAHRARNQKNSPTQPPYSGHVGNSNIISIKPTPKSRNYYYNFFIYKSDQSQVFSKTKNKETNCSSQSVKAHNITKFHIIIIYSVLYTY